MPKFRKGLPDGARVLALSKPSTVQVTTLQQRTPWDRNMNSCTRANADASTWLL